MEGVPDPENVNGDLEVPALGKRFARQGAGYGDPKVDEKGLRAKIGNEKWEAVCELVEVPATTKKVFSLKKFMDLARADVALLDSLTECLVPGSMKSPSLATPNLSDKET